MTDSPQHSGTLLIVDDEPVAVNNLAHALNKNGYNVLTCTSGQKALALLEKKAIDIVLTDLRMEGVDGMAVLQRAKQLDPDMVVIMITGYASFTSAVEVMKAGAFYYIAKPFRLDEVREIVRNGMELVRTRRENKLLRTWVAADHAGPRIITQNTMMQGLMDMARQVGPTDCNILLSGESGTGKELFARYLHAHSNRATGPFVAVNCGALQEDLLANELFGHEKGAFTGATDAKIGLIESANGGTLFLDEIAEMSLAMQIKLLRVIQEREVQPLGAIKARAVNVRIIAATLRDLQREVTEGRFRQDLYFRLNVVALHLPQLAARRDDIPLLAFYFLKKHALRMHMPIDDIEQDALEILCGYDYPGNIRELENLMERGVALSTSNNFTVRDLPPALREQAISILRDTGSPLPTLEQREAEYISQVLKYANGNRTQAAKILGIDRVSLWRKITRHGLNAKE